MLQSDFQAELRAWTRGSGAGAGASGFNSPGISNFGNTDAGIVLSAESCITERRVFSVRVSGQQYRSPQLFHSDSAQPSAVFVSLLPMMLEECKLPQPSTAAAVLPSWLRRSQPAARCECVFEVLWAKTLVHIAYPKSIAGSLRAQNSLLDYPKGLAVPRPLQTHYLIDPFH